MVAAIAEGYPQREIADAAYRFQREFDAGERRIVGVNAYVDDAEVTPMPVLAVPRGLAGAPHGAARADAPGARRGGGRGRAGAGCARRPRGPARPTRT